MTPTHTAYVNARLLDPASGLDSNGGLLSKGGVIEDIGPHIKAGQLPDGADVIDAKGHCLAPGLIDMHAYLCEPGQEHRETIATAGAAAAAGGVTTINAMPDTLPVIDEAALVELVHRRAAASCAVNVVQTGALTKGLKGEEMAEIGLLAEAGVVALGDGPHAIGNINLMRRALTYATMFDLPVIARAEEPALVGSGVINAGQMATMMGLSGIPPLAEAIMVARDVRLAEMTGARWHGAQLSTKDALDSLRRAKDKQVRVTCGTAPHYLALNDLEVGEYRTFAKVSPPLRAEEDRLATIEGLKDGAIDVISSQHCPQSADSKRLPIAQATAGVIGLETMLTVCLRLYHGNDVDLLTLLGAMTVNPAKILGLNTGRLAKGMPTDLVIFDLNRPWKISGPDLRSKSKNTAFDGHMVQGRVMRTVVSGQTVFEFQREA